MPRHSSGKRSDDDLLRARTALKSHLEQFNHGAVRRYADIQRERGRLISIGEIDVDVDQLVERTFLCDRHLCVEWTPHRQKVDARPLIDNSCCARYTVPVTDLDRHKLAEILPRVRTRLSAHHPLNLDEASPPYQID